MLPKKIIKWAELVEAHFMLFFLFPPGLMMNLLGKYVI